MAKPNKTKQERTPIRVLTFPSDKAVTQPGNNHTDALADAIRKAWIQSRPKAS